MPTTQKNDDLKPQPVLNAMTVDVEDYFQVSAFDPYISKDSWSRYPGRVEANTDKILTLFSDYNVKATFFTLGWVAQKYPALIRRIVDDGHDMASHGWDHTRVTQLTQPEFAADIRKSKQILEDTSGQRVTGYRAPSYSFNKDNQWTHPTLVDEGYLYSSSIAPINHPFYGFPGAPRFAHTRADDTILELPITTTRLIGKNYPCGGGGWFRLYPYGLSRWGLNRVNNNEKEAAIFYFHPWEIDPQQPRVSCSNPVAKFRHYQNLAHMEGRLKRLMNDFAWGTIPDAFGSSFSDYVEKPAA